jgi:hypothetical protein
MNCVRMSSSILVLSLYCIPSSPCPWLAYADTKCFQCRTNSSRLIGITREIENTRLAVKSSEMGGEGLGGTVEPLAPYEKPSTDRGIVEDENHGELDFHECHGGNPNDPKNAKMAAEIGLVL